MSLFKDMFLGGLSFLGLPKDRAVILMYHSVSADVDYFMNVEPKDFERQMAYLSGTKRPVISLDELVRRLKAGEPLGGAIAITFDDGYRDNYETVFPILKRYNFPATIFVTTDLIGRSDKRDLRRLTVEQLKEMEASGLIDIEPHTRSHPRLTKLGELEARGEIVGAKEVLEELLQKRCRHFAYPYGDFNAVTERLVREAGFGSVCSVHEGSVRAGSEPLRLSRASIDASTSFAQFRGKLTRAGDVYEYCKHMV